MNEETKQKKVKRSTFLLGSGKRTNLLFELDGHFKNPDVPGDIGDPRRRCQQSPLDHYVLCVSNYVTLSGYMSGVIYVSSSRPRTIFSMLRFEVVDFAVLYTCIIL